MMGSAQLKQVAGYSVTRSLRDARSLKLLHPLCMPNHHLDDAKKSLLLKYNNGDLFTEYDIYLINVLIEVGI